MGNFNDAHDFSLSLTNLLQTRQSTNTPSFSNGSSSTDALLNLIADPFSTEVQSNSIYAALIWSFAVSGLLFLLFVLLRPRDSHVYARRLKVADEKHAPRPLSRHLFGFIPAIRDVHEQEMVEKVGLDATIFLRFLRMLRNLFLVLSVIGCAVVIPVNLVGAHSFYSDYNNVSTLLKFTPQYIFGEKFWAFVILAYVFQFLVFAFIWWNYRTVLRLRQQYLRSDEYTKELHSRTLMVRRIPKDARTDGSLAELVSAKYTPDEWPRTAIGRNVSKWDLPELIEEHENAVRQLEKVLAKYTKKPDHLPEKRPTIKVPKSEQGTVETDSSGKADAIDYLERKIEKLAQEINEARDSIDKRNPESYGFASYSTVENAHAVAYMNRTKRNFLGRKTGDSKKADKTGLGDVSITMAPKPNDILWQNLGMTRATRKNRAFWDSLWMVLLTIAFIIPNALTSIFLSDFSHLGLVWPAFNRNLQAHPVGWGIAQGIIAPSVQLLFYLAMPRIFRRILTHSGDPSRTTRERHVTSRLYGFFVFNNLIFFCIFASGFRYAASVVAAKREGFGAWDAIKKGHLFVQLMTGLCNTSTFWLTWQMQHNLSAATDLSQLLPLGIAWFKKRFMSPTPRELIELSAPQEFEYADYYNNFLFVATVGLCFATLQPIILPVTAFYLTIECWWKKYMLQYIFFTKIESGGAFWRMVYNRMLFAVAISNAVIALIVGAQGIGDQNVVKNGGMLYAMIPLVPIFVGFKYYLMKSFDSKMPFLYPNPLLDSAKGLHHTYSSDPEARPGSGERQTAQLAAKFGHPALYKPLLTIMVSKRAEHLLPQVLNKHVKKNKDIGDFDIDTAYNRPLRHQYSDLAIPMHNLGRTDTGSNSSTAALVHPAVEVVSDADIDAERFRYRPEFRDEFGGGGQLYGRPEDAIGGTPYSEREQFLDEAERSPQPKPLQPVGSWEADDDGAVARSGDSHFATLDEAIRPGLERGPVSGFSTR